MLPLKTLKTLPLTGLVKKDGAPGLSWLSKQPSPSLIFPMLLLLVLLLLLPLVSVTVVTMMTVAMVPGGELVVMV